MSVLPLLAAMLLLATLIFDATAPVVGSTPPSRDHLLCSSANYCATTCPNTTAQVTGTIHRMMGNSSGEQQLHSGGTFLLPARERGVM